MRMTTGPRFTGITASDQPIPLGEAPIPVPPPAAETAGGTTLSLALADLLPDARGEIVILDHSGHDIAVVTHEAIAAQGIGDAHVTAAGLDVSGFSYCTFEGGVTVFYPATHRLFVTQDS
jgi:hypothetical protein